ncbi:hypothetical protein [Paenibacillus eucommiae]|uniref:Uncharacterized protein YwqG n=1 Tax=Paenibacillus eucommiae TaxID=1355755 RepID=A0ABS4IP59_9BACL|nr:hypothetical protein [Paenibacillus eucommiae]MBP1989347.1 uncharacterized protein YwqG [Paenibacillus eucommiae]
MDALINNMNDVDKKYNELNTTSLSQKQEIVDARTRNEEAQIYNESLLSDEVYKLNRIFEKLPQVTKKLAYIKKLQAENDTYSLTVDYVEWYGGEEAVQAAKEDKAEDAASLNNGFYIRNKQIENKKVTAKEDLLIYQLDGTKSRYVGFQDFVNEKDSIENSDRLFNIHFVNNELVLLEEQYRP